MRPAQTLETALLDAIAHARFHGEREVALSLALSLEQVRTAREG